MKTFVLSLALAAVCLAADDSAQWVERTLAQMPLARKVAQIVFVDVSGTYLPDDDPRLAGWMKLVRDYGVGGVVIYGGSPRDAAALLNKLQRASTLPLLAASDFEGGPGQQFAGATEFPGNMAFAAIGSEELVYRAAKAGATEGRAMGIHLTYSPVVDLSTQPENPAESVRTFGGDVNLLGKLVASYIRGYMDHGMLATAKHFPGRGSVIRYAPAPAFYTVGKDPAAIEKEDFAAFRKAIDAGVPFVMTEHVILPGMAQGSDRPASVERKLATGWLRERLGFKGILTTDDLWYDHMVDRFGPVRVGVEALLAGHDLLLKPKDPVAMIEGVIRAVRAGEVPEAHIDQAVRKLLLWKARLNLHNQRLVDESKVAGSVGTTTHSALAQEVADRSVTALKNDGVFPLPAEARSRILNLNIQKLENDPSPDALTAKLQAAFASLSSVTLRPGSDPALHASIRKQAEASSLIVLSLFVQRDKMGEATPLRESDLRLIRELCAAKPGRVIAMAYGNPHLIRKLGDVPAFLVGYGERSWFGNQPIYFDSFVRVLKGDLKPEGKLPVMVSTRYPIGSGVRW
ncbi:MAG: glycoside hydrolase family 3 N-terminal domain-containing protein [Bryobacteraceae bacterium]